MHLVGRIPFYSYALVCFLALLYYLRRGGESLRSLGLRKGGVTLGSVALGLFSALVWAAFMRWVYAPVVSHFFTVPDYTEYDFIRGNVKRLAATLVAAWMVGGFYEEVVFRGFMQTTFEKHLKGSKGYSESRRPRCADSTGALSWVSSGGTSGAPSSRTPSMTPLRSC